MKTKFILTILIPLAATTNWGCRKAGQERPNIVLITLDTARADHLSCYGYGRRTTPNLDRLAEEGRLFPDAVAVSSWTLPAHASLFTGLYPSTHGAHYAESGELSLNSALPGGEVNPYGLFRADGLPEEAETIAEVLKDAGYATGGIGAGPWLKEVFGLAQGFDFYDCNVSSVNGRRADEVTALAVPFLRSHAQKPFFLFLNYFDPHKPYKPPAELTFKFFPEEKLKNLEWNNALMVDFNISQYDSEIYFMDSQIGLIFEELKKLGIYDKTWLIVLGDHGELLGDHGLVGHGYTLFESSIKIPLIIKWPKGREAVSPTGSKIQQVDIMPTILAYLGIEQTAYLEGCPFRDGPHTAACELYRNAAFAQNGGERFDRDLNAAYDGPYKLILSSKEGDTDAGLFDLRNDPAEMHDLSKEKPALASRLRLVLDQWKRSLLPPLPRRRIESIGQETREQLNALGYGT